MAQNSAYNTEVSWQVWEKTDSWFPIQPRKNPANFLPSSQRVETSNLMGLVFEKGTLLDPKTVAGLSSYDTKVSWQV